ncbi:MAG: sialidase family protein [Armatimonadia bacterium]
MSAPDLALSPPPVNTDPGPEYHTSMRLWQGIPSVERASDGRLYATWYSGGKTEDPDNYALIVRSDDGGDTWTEPILVVDPPGEVRAFDSNLWTDPLGRLWFFWAQSHTLFDGRVGVWTVRCDDPAAETLTWSEPRRLANGIMLNKPTVLSTGEWLLPTALWRPSSWLAEDSPAFGAHPELDGDRFSNMLVSRDSGESFALLGQADVPERVFDEHMIVERRDGSLWMLVRTLHGIGESHSFDRGKTWTAGQDSGLGGPCSRFFISRLHSGRLLLVNHHDYTGRNNLTALLSDDDGATWPWKLLLDGRDSVSYPDGFQAPDGTIQIIYDRERYGAKEILLARFTEEDIMAGEPKSAVCRLQHVVNQAGRTL